MKFRTKLLCVMKLTTALILFTAMHIYAKTSGQIITYSARNAKLEQVFRALEQQTGYGFFYQVSDLKNARPVRVELKNLPFPAALKMILKNQGLDFVIDGKTVFITPQKKEEGLTQGIRPGLDQAQARTIDVRGTIKDENGKPVAGASVQVKGTKLVAISDDVGYFKISGVPEHSVLIVTSVGYIRTEILIPSNFRQEITIDLKQSFGKLDEVQVIGYGTTTKRMSTGSVVKISSDEIAAQPVTNVLEALKGRVPGMFVQSTKGITGAGIMVQIQGVNSIAAGTSPLYLVDGVPYGGASLDLVSVNSNTPLTGAGLNPLNSLSPSDIESVEILKGGDATAIYGSRAANGVVLITTKKGSLGKTSLAIDCYGGFGEVPKFIKMQSISQYLEMRRMAFVNDGITPTNANAPDLRVWDTTRTTDWQQELIGGKAAISNTQLSLSGGTERTRFLFSGTYRYTGTVYNKDIGDKRITGFVNLDHRSADNKFGLNLMVNYGTDDNTMVDDPTPYLNLPPHYPVYDANGKLIWRPNATIEPYATMLTRFSNQTRSFVSNVALRYTVLKGLHAKANIGYANVSLQQLQAFPIASQNPLFNSNPTSYFGNNSISTWLVEPQLTYEVKVGPGIMGLLAGFTLQQNITEGRVIYASNFNSDAFLDNIAMAGNLRILNNNDTRYRYNSGFGRINYNIRNKYIVNASWRRDGSSRFGPSQQFGNFGAIGMAWVFSAEERIRKNLPFLSYGKLRGSFGVTGNDQITDYQFLSTYIATTQPYLIPGIRVQRLANPDYSWETNKKLEASLDLGFIKDRLLLSVSYYRNRTENQLVNYPIPGQTGFGSYQANLPAIVQNTGWEFTVNANLIKNAALSWNAAINLTIPKTKLLSFPGLDKTSYGTANLVVGQPLGLVWGFQYEGVDPATGTAMVKDLNNNGSFSSPGDFVPLGTQLPDYYGGLTTTLKYKAIQVDLGFQIASKLAQALPTGSPGTVFNQPAFVYDRIWKKPGDLTVLPKASTSSFPGYYYYAYSDQGYFEDATYLKLQNLSITYTINKDWLRKVKMNSAKIYLRGQNLVTFSNYSGYDPETGSPSVLPNLRVLTAGLRCEF